MKFEFLIFRFYISNQGSLVIEKVGRIGDDVKDYNNNTHFVISKIKLNLFQKKQNITVIHNIDLSSSNSW